MLIRLSAMTPRPTQRCIPSNPLYRHRRRPCRRLATLIRPSHPVCHFWPLRNQFPPLSFTLRALGGAIGDTDTTQTRLTPMAFAFASFFAE
jgi:hypothetical protein